MRLELGYKIWKFNAAGPRFCFYCDGPTFDILGYRYLSRNIMSAIKNRYQLIITHIADRSLNKVGH